MADGEVKIVELETVYRVLGNDMVSWSTLIGVLIRHKSGDAVWISRVSQEYRGTIYFWALSADGRELKLGEKSSAHYPLVEFHQDNTIPLSLAPYALTRIERARNEAEKERVAAEARLAREAETERQRIELEKQEAERLRREQELQAYRDAFRELCSRFWVHGVDGTEPNVELFAILTKLDQNEPLRVTDTDYLERHQYNGPLAVYHDRLFALQPTVSAGLKASSRWRDVGNYYRAMELSDQMLQIRGADQNDAIWTNRGGVLRDTGNLDEAEACAWRANGLKPNSFFPYNLLGGIYFDRKDFEQGEKFFETAVAKGAARADVSRQMENLVGQIGNSLTRSDAARYLLEKNRTKYSWARKYV